MSTRNDWATQGEDFFPDRAAFFCSAYAGFAWRRVRDYLQGLKRAAYGGRRDMPYPSAFHGFLIVQCTSFENPVAQIARVVVIAVMYSFSRGRLAANRHGLVHLPLARAQLGSIRGLPVGM